MCRKRGCNKKGCLQTQTNANKRRQTQLSGTLKWVPNADQRAQTQANVSKHRQTRTSAKSVNFTSLYAPPFAAAQMYNPDLAGHLLHVNCLLEFVQVHPLHQREHFLRTTITHGRSSRTSFPIQHAHMYLMHKICSQII